MKHQLKPIRPSLVLAFMATTALALTASTVKPGNTTVKPDNSAINARDTSVLEPTAEQQSSQARDIEITRQIRKDVMNIKDLSSYGKNVKIITEGGNVTLKGPVRSDAEKKNIEQVAARTSGVKAIFNQLDVVTAE